MNLLAELTKHPNTIIPAAGDGSTIQFLAQMKPMATYLSGQLASQTLLAENDEGLISESEYAKFLRDMCLKTPTTLIADLQSGFGSPLNAYYAAQDLERSGADILILNDQPYPAHSQPHPASTTAEDLLGKTRAALDAFENPATQLWIKLEGIGNYGIDGIRQRAIYLAKAGAHALIIDHATTDQLRELTSAPLALPLLATWTTKTEQLDQVSGWLDTGTLAKAAQEAHQAAYHSLLEGALSHAKK